MAEGSLRAIGWQVEVNVNNVAKNAIRCLISARIRRWSWCPTGGLSQRVASADVTQAKNGDRRRTSRPAKITAGKDEVNESVIQLAAETLGVGKRVVETGRVRVRRTTTERLEKVKVPLAVETVEIRRVPIGKPIKRKPRVRETANEIIIPVVEEVLVVERRLVLKEELHIRKVRSTENHIEQVTLRQQNVTVDRVAPQSSDDGQPSANRPKRPSRSRRPGIQQRK